MMNLDCLENTRRDMWPRYIVTSLSPYANTLGMCNLHEQIFFLKQYLQLLAAGNSWYFREQMSQGPSQRWCQTRLAAIAVAVYCQSTREVTPAVMSLITSSSALICTTSEVPYPKVIFCNHITQYAKTNLKNLVQPIPVQSNLVPRPLFPTPVWPGNEVRLDWNGLD